MSPAFLFAALLWHEVLAAWKAREKRGERRMPALEAAMDEVLDAQSGKLAITRRLTATMREVWAMQPRFEERSGQRPYRLLELPRFRMAYDFLALRAASGEVPAELRILVARVPERGRRNAPARCCCPTPARTRSAAAGAAARSPPADRRRRTAAGMTHGLRRRSEPTSANRAGSCTAAIEAHEAACRKPQTRRRTRATTGARPWATWTSRIS